jgi:hypothetical protein
VDLSFPCLFIECNLDDLICPEILHGPDAVHLAHDAIVPERYFYISKFSVDLEINVLSAGPIIPRIHHSGLH